MKINEKQRRIKPPSGEEASVFERVLPFLLLAAIFVAGWLFLFGRKLIPVIGSFY